jgi:hypothetical protein
MKLARATGDSRWPKAAGMHVYNVLRDLDDVLREGYLRATNAPARGFSFRRGRKRHRASRTALR